MENLELEFDDFKPIGENKAYVNDSVQKIFEKE